VARKHGYEDEALMANSSSSARHNTFSGIVGQPCWLDTPNPGPGGPIL